MHTGGNGCSDTKRKIILILIKQKIWSKSPIFDDVADFFARCPLPIYIVTNNGMEYVQVAMKDNHLNPAGIICGDMVKVYKPHKEIFGKALKISGCHADEKNVVLHIRFYRVFLNCFTSDNLFLTLHDRVRKRILGCIPALTAGIN